MKTLSLALTLVWLVLVGCSSPSPSPIPAPTVTGIVIEAPATVLPAPNTTALAPARPTATAAATATTLPTVPTPEPVTPALVLTFVEATDVPTLIPQPTSEVAATSLPAPSAPAPNRPGVTAAAAMAGVLSACWGVNEFSQLNANNPAHVSAFECARPQLLRLAANYPAYPDVHRVLAWGFIYRDSNLAAAVGEYRAAASLYHAAGDPNGESEARMRLGLLLVGSDPNQGCAELGAAVALNAQNTRAALYFTSYQCSRLAQARGTPTPVLGEPNLAAIRGQILFKSNREGVERLYVVDRTGAGLKRVDDARLYSAAARWESFSPDRTQVATVRLEGFDKQFGGDNNDIWVTDPSGGSGRALANPHNDYDPVWSPRGLYDGRTWLAFVSNRGDIGHPDAKGDNLWLEHEDGTNSVRLTCFPNYRFGKHPSFSPEASQIVFTSDLNGVPQLWIADLDKLGNTSDGCQIGAAARLLVGGGQFSDYDPVWVK